MQKELKLQFFKMETKNCAKVKISVAVNSIPQSKVSSTYKVSAQFYRFLIGAK